jgi:hypothetical protein
MMLLLGYSLSLTLSHKWEREQNSVASPILVIEQIRGKKNKIILLN